MRELACNVVAYRPDRQMLASNFRPWHVAALLDQAATLIDRCLQDFDKFCTLQYEWNRLWNDLKSEERQLEFYRSEAEGGPETETASSPGWVWHSEEPRESLEGAGQDLSESAQQPSTHAEPAARRRSSHDLQAEALQRKKELSAPGGPFALDERRDHALKRLCRDYEEAVNRACVAEEGLKLYYDHFEPSSPLPPEDQALGASITHLANWIRNANEWLARYRQKEDAFTRVVSVRSLLARNAWVQLKQARDSFSAKLQIPANLFREHDNCRLRGVGASLIGEAGKVPWSIVLKLPEQALYQRSGQIVEADQSGRPPCFLGRVENRRSLRPLEICGVSSWINASPLGRSTAAGLWSLEMFKPMGATSESFGHVEDLVLEIDAVGTGS